MLESVARMTVDRIVGVGDPEPIDGRVVDEAPAGRKAGGEGAENVARPAMPPCVRSRAGGAQALRVRVVHPVKRHALERRPAIGLVGEARRVPGGGLDGVTFTSWMTKLPSPVPVLVSVSVASGLRPGS